jgi:CO dehydrogenase/acetyl-CoA synthase epsilon subunit
MTSLYFESDDGTQLDTAIFDGYYVGDRILEEVKFIVKIKDGRLHPTIHPDDAGYFSTLNEDFWIDEVTRYVQDHDVFEHPESSEDVYLVVQPD